MGADGKVWDSARLCSAGGIVHWYNLPDRQFGNSCQNMKRAHPLIQESQMKTVFLRLSLRPVASEARRSGAPVEKAPLGSIFER